MAGMASHEPGVIMHTFILHFDILSDFFYNLPVTVIEAVTVCELLLKIFQKFLGIWIALSTGFGDVLPWNWDNWFSNSQELTKSQLSYRT